MKRLFPTKNPTIHDVEFLSWVKHI